MAKSSFRTVTGLPQDPLQPVCQNVSATIAKRQKLQRSKASGIPQAHSCPAWKSHLHEVNLHSFFWPLQTQKVNQEDVSAWMTGIVEVPLSVKGKLKNVEETELAKRRLLSDPGDSEAG